MNIAMSHEDALLRDTVRNFINDEIIPHEERVDELGEVPEDVGRTIEAKAKELGLYAANLPENVGGGGLNHTQMALIEREFGRTSHALHAWVARPTELLLACRGDQVERYLNPCVTGEKRELFALTEPEAGLDAMGMKSNAKRDGDDWILNGTKHFISAPTMADFAIVFAVTGLDETKRGPRKRITAFLVDRDMPGVVFREGNKCVSNRGYKTYELTFDDVRLAPDQVLGEEGNGLAWVAFGWVPPVVAKPSACSNWPVIGPPIANNSANRLVVFRPPDFDWRKWPLACGLRI